MGHGCCCRGFGQPWLLPNPLQFRGCCSCVRETPECLRSQLGYRFQLTPPVPVTILDGDVRGNARSVKGTVPLTVVPLGARFGLSLFVHHRRFHDRGISPVALPLHEDDGRRRPRQESKQVAEIAHALGCCFLPLTSRMRRLETRRLYSPALPGICKSGGARAGGDGHSGRRRRGR